MKSSPLKHWRLAWGFEWWTHLRSCCLRKVRGVRVPVIGLYACHSRITLDILFRLTIFFFRVFVSRFGTVFDSLCISSRSWTCNLKIFKFGVFLDPFFRFEPCMSFLWEISSPFIPKTFAWLLHTFAKDSCIWRSWACAAQIGGTGNKSSSKQRLSSRTYPIG